MPKGSTNLSRYGEWKLPTPGVIVSKTHGVSKQTDLFIRNPKRNKYSANLVGPLHQVFTMTTNLVNKMGPQKQGNALKNLPFLRNVLQLTAKRLENDRTNEA